MAESVVQNNIRLAVSRVFGRAVILFRNNRGKAWIGKSTKTNAGLVIIEHPRRIEFGLVNGASDLLGWTEKIVTPDMVGKTIAVFTVIEAKDEGGLVSKEQKTFIANVKRAGGIAGVARSGDDAIKILQGQDES